MRSGLDNFELFSPNNVKRGFLTVSKTAQEFSSKSIHRRSLQIDYNGILNNDSLNDLSGDKKRTIVEEDKIIIDTKNELEDEDKKDDYKGEAEQSEQMVNIIFKEDMGETGLPNLHLMELTRQQGEIMKIHKKKNIATVFRPRASLFLNAKKENGNLGKDIYDYLKQQEEKNRRLLKEQTLLQKFTGFLFKKKSNFQTIKKELKNLQNLRILYECIYGLDKELKMKKAVRHFQDAIKLRRVRHDLEKNENPIINKLYFWQTNYLWQKFLSVLSLVYIIIIPFFEPSNSRDVSMDKYDNSFQTMYIFEIIFGIFVLIDVGAELTHLWFDKSRSLIKKYIKNKKFFFRGLIYILWVIDISQFYYNYPNSALKFTRLIRPAFIFMFSKEQRRLLKGIIRSAFKLVDIMVFFITVNLIWAAIGYKMISCLDGDIEYDEYLGNFSEFAKAAVNMYVLVSFDGYPDVMYPALEKTYLYLIYFVTYVCAFLLILTPIPVAIVYENFRNYRARIVVSDRFKQNEALFACYMCLEPEENEQSITIEKFSQLMMHVYKKKKITNKIKSLAREIDKERNGKITITEFFDIIDIMRSDKKFRLKSGFRFDCWIRFRSFLKKSKAFIFLNKKNYLALLVNILTPVDIVVLIFSTFLVDKVTSDRLDIFDYCCILLYIIDAMFFMINHGFILFFDEGWNILDFLILISSLVVETMARILQDNFLIVYNSYKGLHKLEDLFKIFRIIRTGVRSISLINKYTFGLNVVIRTKQLMLKISLCIPIFIKLLSILMTVFYIYTITGMELFNTETNKYREDSPYADGTYVSYTNFNSFGGGLLILLQICTESGWGSMIFDLAYKFDNFALSIFFICTFHLITLYIVLSLLRGLIWEVFLVVDETISNQESKRKVVRQQHTKQIKEISSDEDGGHVNHTKTIKSNKIEKENETLMRQFSKKEHEVNKKGENKMLGPNFTYHSFNDFENILNGEKQSSSLISSIISSSSENLLTAKKKAAEKIVKNTNIIISKPKKLENDILSPIKSSKDDAISLIESVAPETQKKEEWNLLLKVHKFGIPNPENKNPFRANIKTDSFYSELSRYQKEEGRKTQTSPKKRTRSLTEKNTLFNSNIEIKKRELQGLAFKRSGSNDGNNKRCVSIESHKDESRRDDFENINITKRDFKSDIENFDSRKKILVHNRNKSIHSLNLSENSASSSSSSSSAETEKAKSKNENLSDTKKSPLHSVGTSDSSVSDNDIAKIYIYKKRILQLSYFSKKHLEQKFRELGQQNTFNLRYDCFDSDDDTTAKYLGNFIDKDFDQDEDKIKNFYPDRTKNLKKEDLVYDLAMDKGNSRMREESIDHKAIIQKAFLKDTDIKKLKNFEMGYFSQKYGDLFQNARDSDHRAALEMERKCISFLNIVMQYKNIQITSFMNFLFKLERKISKKLMKPGSFCKFLFKTKNNVWFMVNLNPSKQFSVVRMHNEGPWTFFHEVFPKKNQVYLSRDVFKDLEHEQLSDILEELYNSLKPMANVFSNKYESIGFDKAISDLFFIPLVNTEIDIIKYKTKKRIKHVFPDISDEKIRINNYIDNILVICLSMHEISKNSSEGPIKFDEIKKATQKGDRLPVYSNSIRMRLHKTIETEKFTLPFAHLVQMMKDMNDIFRNHSRNLFIKSSEFLFYKQNPWLVGKN